VTLIPGIMELRKCWIGEVQIWSLAKCQKHRQGIVNIEVGGYGRNLWQHGRIF